jgi:hypothetical protein
MADGFYKSRSFCTPNTVIGDFITFSTIPMSSDIVDKSSSLRKLHKKSKSGCRTCKQRKIKVRQPSREVTALMLSHEQCDEARPVCSNCVRRYGVGGP